jgi:hypothetical protein
MCLTYFKVRNIQEFVWKDWEQPHKIFITIADSRPDFEPITFRMWLKYGQEELILKTVKTLVC